MRGRGLSLKYVANSKRTSYRAAVVVSKKVHKSAVVRNRIRRRVYEIIRTSTNPATPVDFAFMIYDEAVATMPAEQTQGLIMELLVKAKLVSGS